VKEKDWVVASEPLAEALAGFRRMKRGFVRTVGEWVAAGIYCDNSAHSKTVVYLQAFALPLYIPKVHLWYPFGFRIGNTWDRVDDQAVAAAVKAVPKLMKLADLRAMVKQGDRWKIDPNHLEVRLGAGILLDDRRLVEDARVVLPSWPVERDWEHQIVKRCAQLLDIVDAQGRNAAVAELARRREVVMAVLR
jgi:hypothetical protein